jgi:hypothetical protein
MHRDWLDRSKFQNRFDNGYILNHGNLRHLRPPVQPMTKNLKDDETETADLSQGL